MHVGDLKARFLTTFTAQLITLVSAVVDPVTGLPLRNVLPIDTLEGVICWRSCEVGIIFVNFICRVMGDITITFGGRWGH